MAKNETSPLPARKLTEDQEIYGAVKGIANYSPANQAYTVAALDAKRAELEGAFQTLAQAEAAAEAARDSLVAKQWEFHNLILGTKDQIVAQFGPDSDEVQAVKLKKKSEYKRPTRKKTGEK